MSDAQDDDRPPEAHLLAAVRHDVRRAVRAVRERLSGVPTVAPSP
jgi:hypothetical protein